MQSTEKSAHVSVIEKVGDSMYKIGELSKLCRVPVKTLRYYDDIGLLVPDEIDEFTGYRYYSASKIEECTKILALKELGFTLGEIKQFIEADSAENLIGSINQKCSDLRELLLQTESQLRQLDHIRMSLEKGKMQMYHVIIRKSDPIRMASVRNIFQDKSDAYTELQRIRSVLPKNIIGNRNIIIHYETEYRNQGFDLAVGVEITGDFEGNSGLTEKIITFESETAVIVCQENELENAYDALIGRMDELDYKAVGAFYEIYHSDGTVELKVPVETAVPYIPSEKLPFENDPDAVGRWKMIDIVPSEDCFIYGHTKCSHLAWLDEIYFLRDGAGYWAVDGWTKGILYTKEEFSPAPTAQQYRIRRENGHDLLFLRKSRTTRKDGQLMLQPSEIWVYEKSDSREYTASDIKRRDMTDYPFVFEKSVIGRWMVRDFYPWKFEENFDPGKQNYADDDLFVREVEFREDGTYTQVTKRHTSTLCWTSFGEGRGLLLNRALETASAYEIRMIDGTEYLISEWKTGDYQYGSVGRIYHYVFVRG